MRRGVRTHALAPLVALLTTTAPARAELSADAIGRGIEADDGLHTVRADETLSAIAARYGVSLERLLEQNPELDPDRIRPGQTIRLGEEHRVVHYTVKPGDTLGAVARRFDVSVDELVRSHPGLRPERLRAGQTLRVRTGIPASVSRSVGKPHQGRLIQARRLPLHPGWVIRDRERAWGTDETVDALVGAIDELQSAHPRAPRIEVHDLSFRDGGPIDDHRSHESGRDADLALFQKRCAGGVCAFRRATPNGLDVERQWTLLHHLLREGEVEAVFLDYRLQRPLYEHARSHGATADELGRWFQYPRGQGSPLGIIRHARNHADHLHVRFTCHASDGECESLRPLLTRHASR